MTYRHPQFMTLLLAGVLALSGCDLIGVVSDKFAGDLPIPPAYTPDPTLPLVVIAENYRDPGNTTDTMRLQEIVSDRLNVNKVAPIIGTERLMEVRDRSPKAYRKMSVVEIAKAVGAAQVVYIDLTRISVGTQMGSSAIKGTASANVKLIDARSGQVLYPTDMDVGAVVSFETEIRQASADMNADRIRGEILMGLGIRIGQHFHTYRRSDSERIDTYE